MSKDATDSPWRGGEEKDFVGIKGLPLDQESDVRHLFVIEEVGI